MAAMAAGDTGAADEYAFEIVTQSRVYQLVAMSQQDMNDWMLALSHHTALGMEVAFRFELF